MKTNKSHIGLLFLIFSILLATCSDFREIKVGSPSAIIVKSIRDNIINVDLSIPIVNPNDKQFKITKINLEVVVNENYLGKITNANNVIIKGNSDEKHIFNLDLEVKSIVKGLISMVNVFGSGKVEIESRGFIKARSGLIAKSIPVENSATIKVRNRIPWLKDK